MDSRDLPLPAEVRSAILETCFDLINHADTEKGQWLVDNSYLDHYQLVLQESHGTRTWSTVKTHGAILEVLQLIRNANPAGNRDEVRKYLRSQLQTDEIDDADEILDGSINLATRLLIMVPTGGQVSAGRSLIVSGETKFDWKSGTITDLVLKRMAHQVQIEEKVKLERLFNARNLERIGGIAIRWTNNLADHLRMRDDDKVVEVFHYASFLRLHDKGTIFPPGFIDETTKTLALLFPEHDMNTRKWFREEQAKFQKRKQYHLDPLARECGQLKVSERKIEAFKYYHDRLVVLKQVFDEAEPSNIKQWWYDRRRKVQWYTFWVAILVLGLTIAFGIIQSVEGAMQVNLAMKANH